MELPFESEHEFHDFSSKNTFKALKKHSKNASEKQVEILAKKGSHPSLPRRNSNASRTAKTV
jgi:hypothetical protein